MIRALVRLLSAAAGVIAAAAAAVAAPAAPTVAAAAAAEQDDNQDDDPQAVAAAPVIVTAPHKEVPPIRRLREVFALLTLILCAWDFGVPTPYRYFLQNRVTMAATSARVASSLGLSCRCVPGTHTPHPTAQENSSRHQEATS